MWNILPPSFRVIPTLKMEAARSSEALADVYNTTASHTGRYCSQLPPGDSNIERSEQYSIMSRYNQLRIFALLRGGANKSLGRHTARCFRTESIVSLERGACSCAEMKVFSCYRG